MSELRKDPIVSRWVIIATERDARPHHFKSSAETPSDTKSEGCPFCEGNEHMTPPEIYAVRPGGGKANGPGWLVRVIPNKYPVLHIEGDVARRGIGMCDMAEGVGAHEVIVETPRHDQRLSDLPEEHIELVLGAFRERIIDLDRDDRLRYAMVFKNQGIRAGASLPHAHSQLIATPVTPITVKEELQSSKKYYQEKERCIFCDYLKQEMKAGERLVMDDEHFAVIAPFASRFPFEMWVIPKKHQSDYHKISPQELTSLSKILKMILIKLRENLENPDYNMLLHTAPLRTPRSGYWTTIEVDYHWHFEIFPRLTRVAGFEWGTGFYINPTPPERVREFLMGE